LELQENIKQLKEKLIALKDSTSTEKLDVYFELHKTLAKKDFKEALEIAKEAEIEALKTEIPEEIVKAGNWKYIYYAYLGKKEIALNGFEKLIKICDANNINQDKPNLYGNMANCLDAYDKKMYYLLKAIESAKKIDSKPHVAHNLRAVGELDKRFSTVTNNTIQYYLDAVKIYKEITDNYNLAKTYAALGGAYGALDKFKEGETSFIEALKYCKIVNEDWLNSIVYSYQMDFYFTFEKYKECFEIGKEVLPVFKKINDKIGERWVYYTLGKSYFISEDLKQAKHFFKKAKEIDLISDKYYVIEVNEYLEKIEFEQGNINEALRLTKETLALEREKLDVEKTKAVAKMQTQFNTERKEKENLELRIKALRSQMNPHFIFNSLNSIQNFVAKNDAIEAVKYISKFSLLMRQILTASEERHINLEDEIVFLENYLSLEKLRFKERFKYEIVVEKEVDSTFTDIPSMLIQPYVENAILHGMKNISKDGKITITFKSGSKDDFISCAITDNGTGINPNLKDEKKHKSLGSGITKERIEALSKGKSFDVKYAYLDSKNKTGTRVEIEIPIV